MIEAQHLCFAKGIVARIREVERLLLAAHH